jgi:hypothetical protein
MAIFLAYQKHIQILGLLIIIYSSLPAQLNTSHKSLIIDPWTINSNGYTALLPQLILDWNLGDLAHTVHFSNNEIAYITTGYLQNTYNALGLKEKLDSVLLHVNLGPNPFKNSIHISCDQDALTIIAIALFDYQGNCIRQVNGPFSGVHFNQTIPVYELMPPYCIVQIQFTLGDNQRYLKTYKLIQY